MSLQFNVSQFLKSDVGDTRSYDFEADEPIDLDDASATEVTGHVKFTMTNFGVVAAARAHAILHLTCARCLEPFETPVDIVFEEEYQPSIDIASGLPVTAPRNEAAFEISANHTIDLTEALRQNLLLSIELVPVCRADCAGLCPTCGVNRNMEQCACPPAEDSSPFAMLQGLLGASSQE